MESCQPWVAKDFIGEMFGRMCLFPLSSLRVTPQAAKRKKLSFFQNSIILDMIEPKHAKTNKTVRKYLDLLSECPVGP